MVKPVEVVIKAKDEASSVFGTMQGKLKAVAGAVAGYFGFRLFAGIISDSADLEAAMSRVQAATGATASEMVDLRKAADDAGATTKYTSVEAAGALENLAKAGLNAKDSIAALPAVLALAQAGDIELGQASEFLTKAVMGMGLAFTDSGRVADVLAKGANASNTSVTGLAQALSYAAPVAHSLGLSLETTVAIIGKFADAGIDASRAGTALNAILSQFSDPASKFREELRNAGIVTTDFEKALKQLTEAGPNGQKAILAVGTEAGPALRALIGQGTAALADLKGQLDNSAGSAAATAAIMENNLKGAFNGLGSAWDTVKTALGTPVLPILKEGVEQLTNALRVAVSDGTAAKFGESIAASFQAGIKWARDFLSTIDFNKVAADLRVFAEQTGEAFRTVGEHAASAGAVARTAYGVMSAGVNGVLTVVYGLGAAFAGVGAAIQNDLASILSGLAKVTFGEVSRSFKAASEDMKLSASATGAASVALAEKSAASFQAMADGAQTARAGFAGLSASATDIKPAIDASSAAVAKMAAEIESVGQKTVAAKKATDDKKASDDLARASLQQLREEYTQLVAGGSLQAAAEKLQQINTTMQATPGIAQDASKAAKEAAAILEGAFIDLGVVSQAELDKARTSAVRNFEIIKSSGKGSALDIQNAFSAMAQKTLDASGQIGSIGRATEEASLRAKAAALGLKIEFDATGKAIVSAMSNAAASVGSLGAAVKDVNVDLEKQAAALDAINAKYGQSKADREAKYGKVGGDPTKTSDGFDKNADGSAKGTFTNTLPTDTAFSVNARSAAGKLTAADLAEAQAGFKQAKDAKDDMDAFVKLAPGAASTAYIQSTNALFIASKLALEKVQAMDAAQKAAKPAPKSTTQPSASQSTQNLGTANSSQTINITINGRNTAVNVATPDDAAALNSIIEQLASAAGRS